MSIRATARLLLATATSVALAGGLLTVSAGPVNAATPARYADDYTATATATTRSGTAARSP